MALEPARFETDRTVDWTAVRFVTFSRALFVLLTLSFAVATAAGLRLSVPVQSAVYLALMLGLGLLHGGFEHVANLKGRGESLQVRYLAAYVGLLALALGLFWVAPVAGLAVALAITVLKSGGGDLHVLETLLDADYIDSPVVRGLGVLARGGAVMVVALCFHPGIFYMVSSYMVSFFEPGGLASFAWLFQWPARGVLLSGYLLVAVLYLAVGYRRADDRQAWAVDAGELCLLVAFFAAVPPIVAVGVYFPFWYATRQLARTTAASDDHVGLVTVLRRVARGGLLPWLGGLAVFGATALFVEAAPSSPGGWVALYSVVVAAIAVPHVLVGSWLDRRRGIWTV